ncbi:hypothetical protein WBJ53_25050 [Spirosoma sp. SC4-14]|uniref:hypothetical protein n=1 Tax=Spirosoma sp. SC4-14 TaxID=3128900 RepID=UPI0030D0C98D
MRNKYKNQHEGLVFWVFWLTLLGFTQLRAQTVQPPVIQWQRVIESPIPGAVYGRTAIVKNGAGGYSVVTADRRLLWLTTAGEVISDVPITSVSTTGNTIEALSAVSPVATADNAIVIAVLDNQRWTLQKRNLTGELIWITGLNFSQSTQYQYGFSNIVGSSDGGTFAFATRYDQTISTQDRASVIIAKIGKTGDFLWEKELKFSTDDGSNNGVNGINVSKAISTSDGGLLLTGTANPTTDNNTLRGWVAKLTGDGSVVWQKRYGQVNNFNDVSADLSYSNTESYWLTGSEWPNTSSSGEPSTFRINAQGDPIGSPVQVPYPAFNSLATIVAVPQQARPASYVVGNDTPQDSNNGDIRLTGFSEQGERLWSKVLGGSGHDYSFQPAVLPTTDGLLMVGITESNDGDVKGRKQATPATWIVKLLNQGNALTLTQPTYNCQTGAITFNTTGGDGSPITYTAPGITRASVTDNFGTVEQGLRNDPKPILIQATQSGRTVSYTFDFGAYCSNPPANPLQIVAPSVTCGSALGATLVINTSGGDGSPISYAIPGVELASPASNTVDIFKCIDINVPLSIQATQSGYTTTYSLDLKQYCPGIQIFKSLEVSLIPDLTVKTGQTLESYELTNYFKDPNFSIYKYSYLNHYWFTASGMPEGITYSTAGSGDGSGGPNGLVVKFYGKTSAAPGTYIINIAATNGYCDTLKTSFRIVVVESSNNALTLTQPTYNCQTGAITFNTSGGDGTLITYTAPGITRASVTDNFGTVEQGLRNDPKPIWIQATQSGQTASYTFDFGAYCSNPKPPTGGSLALLAPTYNCQTGAITFNTSGGDGSPIEFRAAGITDWTTNPNQFVDKESRTASDVQPFMLMARQSGSQVSYSWDLKAACGRARVGVAEESSNLTITVLGNPAGEQVRVLIEGVEGQAVELELSDVNGRLVERRRLESAGAHDEQVFSLEQTGVRLLLLRATTNQQARTVKIMKQ